MAKIKINLLGKKKAPTPFQLDEHLAKLGVKVEDFDSYKPALTKIAVLVVGLYAGDYGVNSFYNSKIRQLDLKIEAINNKTQAVQNELGAKKEIRRKMEQLNKEEAELRRQLSAIQGLQKDRALAFQTVDTLTTIMPQKIWLTGFNYTDRKVSISGSCWDYFPINDFVKSVNESALFQSVVYKGIRTGAAVTKVIGVSEADQKIKMFELEFKVKNSMGE